MKEGYKTKQREEILSFFRQHPGQHITAQELCTALNGVSKATVYRALDRLVQEGLLRRYTLEGGRQPATNSAAATLTARSTTTSAAPSAAGCSTSRVPP